MSTVFNIMVANIQEIELDIDFQTNQTIITLNKTKVFDSLGFTKIDKCDWEEFCESFDTSKFLSVIDNHPNFYRIISYNNIRTLFSDNKIIIKLS